MRPCRAETATKWAGALEQTRRLVDQQPENRDALYNLRRDLGQTQRRSASAQILDRRRPARELRTRRERLLMQYPGVIL